LYAFYQTTGYAKPWLIVKGRSIFYNMFERKLRYNAKTARCIVRSLSLSGDSVVLVFSELKALLQRDKP